MREVAETAPGDALKVWADAPIAERMARIQSQLVARGVVDIRVHCGPNAEAGQLASGLCTFLEAYLDGEYEVVEFKDRFDLPALEE